MMSDELDIKDYGDVVCPEYSGNICHTMKQKEKELKVYKKALELTCNIIENNAYCPYMCDGNRSCIDCILQKAREEE